MAAQILSSVHNPLPSHGVTHIRRFHGTLSPSHWRNGVPNAVTLLTDNHSDRFGGGEFLIEPTLKGKRLRNLLGSRVLIEGELHETPTHQWFLRVHRYKLLDEFVFTKQDADELDAEDEHDLREMAPKNLLYL